MSDPFVILDEDESREVDEQSWLLTDDRKRRGGIENWRGSNVRTRNGVQERLPALANIRGIFDTKKHHPRAKQRYVMVVRNEGHIVPLILTNGGGHCNIQQRFAIYMLRKARHLGWFRADDCLVRSFKAGYVNPDKILVREMLEAKVCPKDRTFHDGNLCPHARAELEARRQQNAARNTQLEATHKPEAEKHMDAMAKGITDGVNQQMREYSRAIGEGMRDAIRELLAEQHRNETSVPDEAPATTARKRKGN